jgi:hypothetical protein
MSTRRVFGSNSKQEIFTLISLTECLYSRQAVFCQRGQGPVYKSGEIAY